MKKYNKLMTWRNTISGLFIFTALSLVACTDNFENINKDPGKSDPKMELLIQSMQISIMAQNDNSYQRMDDLSGNTYAGYSGQSADYGGSNPTNYYFAATIPWNDAGFQVVYGTSINPKYPVPGVMNTWNIVRQYEDSSSVKFALGEVVKVLGMHRVADMYGPIPYTKYGQSLYTEYDSQETVYKTFFKELDHAIKIMTAFYNADPSAKPIESIDLYLGGDMKKWIQFANSLKLRLAMRIKYVDSTLARQYAEEAINHPLGVIEDNSGNVKIQNSPMYSFVNPIEMLWNGYANMRMGASIESYLNGYNDPRIGKYFTMSSKYGRYAGVRPGIASNGARWIDCSTPNIGVGDPLYFMHAAEVYFLRAEGAIEGWTMGGTAEELYNKGIQTSMELNEISSAATADYIADDTSVPARYTDPVGIYSANALSTITIKWDESSLKDEKLERIITQKYLAMYPNGQEAWSEFRRTGYPKLFPVVTNRSGGSVNTSIQIRRIPFPFEEYTTNNEIVTRAVNNYLNGNDSPGTNLWWDAKP